LHLLRPSSGLIPKQAIAEDRTVSREKYSELKLEANFFKVSPGYLTATPSPRHTSRNYTFRANDRITVTPLVGAVGQPSFYVVRATDYQTARSIRYKLQLPTAWGWLVVPQLRSYLTLHGRDSKMVVTDYPVGDVATLIYSTAEVFTWQKFENRTVLVVYGGPQEQHELALVVKGAPLKWKFTESGYATPQLLVQRVNNAHIAANWRTYSTASRWILRVGSVEVYMTSNRPPFIRYLLWSSEKLTESKIETRCTTTGSRSWPAPLLLPP